MSGKGFQYSFFIALKSVDSEGSCEAFFQRLTERDMNSRSGKGT
jgi:hypothetical protein